ncbi:hypothetical protein PVA23_142 [Vibrio phage PVA23]|nr:hypothetical protein PVA23_142 [Vibrio phage PVA23]
MYNEEKRNIIQKRMKSFSKKDVYNDINIMYNEEKKFTKFNAQVAQSGRGTGLRNQKLRVRISSCVPCTLSLSGKAAD